MRGKPLQAPPPSGSPSNSSVSSQPLRCLVSCSLHYPRRFLSQPHPSLSPSPQHTFQWELHCALERGMLLLVLIWGCRRHICRCYQALCLRSSAARAASREMRCTEEGGRKWSFSLSRNDWLGATEGQRPRLHKPPLNIPQQNTFYIRYSRIKRSNRDCTLMKGHLDILYELSWFLLWSVGAK